MFLLAAAAAVAVSAIAGVSAQQEVANAHPTPMPNYDDSYTKQMPYSWMTSEGYKSVDCAYGWNKDSSSHCTKADWVRRNLLARAPRLADYIWYSSRAVPMAGMLRNDDHQVRFIHRFLILSQRLSQPLLDWIANNLPARPCNGDMERASIL
jgi:hypothetical protein